MVLESIWILCTFLCDDDAMRNHDMENNNMSKLATISYYDLVAVFLFSVHTESSMNESYF